MRPKLFNKHKLLTDYDIIGFLLTVNIIVFLIFISACELGSDDEQVQVVTNMDDFTSFTFPPRDVICGPYTLKVTTESAIIAWEEKSLGNILRHVEVSIESLSASTEYFYRVNGAKKDGRFITAPDDNSSFSFFVWGDSRTDTDIGNQIAEKMLAIDPSASFALHTGDLVLDGDRQECWESEWWIPMSDLLLHFPVYPTMGNHEVNSDYYDRYFSSLGGGGRNYSFNWGGVHVLVLDSNKINFGSDEQIEWITNDLEENEDADFTIVTHHLPVYDASPSGSTGMLYLQDALVPIYEQYGVDLVFNGDVHNYQRHLKNDITYIISACGGEKPYDYGVPLEGMTLQLWKTYNFSHCLLQDDSIQMTTYNHEGIIIDRVELVSWGSADIHSQVEVEASSIEVLRGDQFKLDIFIQEMENIDNLSFTLAYYKDEPPLILNIIDSDLLDEGLQIEAGELGGDVVVNHADNNLGIVEYREENLKSGSYEMVRVASAIFEVPEDAPITALYLVPKFTIIDTSGFDIPHFMGGIKVTIVNE